MKVLDSLTPTTSSCCTAAATTRPAPTSRNAQWDKVAASLKRTGAFPLVDLAYLGFGDGLDEDAYGVRKVVAAVPELMIAFSASKNFGLYRERAGVAIAIAKDAASADVVFEPDAERHPRHHLADRPTTAPKSSASSSRTRSCAPSGRPSSTKCGNA